jgi:serine/threonine-protein kinase Chk1
LGPFLLISLIQESLESLGVKCKNAPRASGQDGPLKLRVGGYDRRKMMYKGWVEVENFSYRGLEGSFCVMKRDVVRFLN